MTDELNLYRPVAQARAIRRAGELLRQIEPDKGGYHENYAQEGARPSTRSQAATEAGMSEHQRKQAQRLLRHGEHERSQYPARAHPQGP